MRERTMSRYSVLFCGAVLLAALALTVRLPAAEPDAEARQILEATGVQGGLVVHLGCGDGKLTTALRVNDRYLVHGLDRSVAKVRGAREHIRSVDAYGPVSVARLTGDRLPYAENLVNLIVAEAPGPVSEDEMLRVLAPGGVAHVKRGGKWVTTPKAWPEEIDEWGHHSHGADGNPVAYDTVVGPPKHYQWLAGPLWFRSHDTDSTISAVVTSGGRIFYIVDEAPTSLPGDHPLPDKWSLAARDAFNGTLLWKRPIEHWGWREWKDTWFTDRPDNLPVNLPMRLVASGDRVYATLGYHAPVSQLNAATGETLQTYTGTDDTREILLHEGTLVLSVFRDGRLKVVAVDAENGRVAWETEKTYLGSSQEYFPQWRRRGEDPAPGVDPILNPATDGKAVAFIDGTDLVCLDYSSGAERWRMKVEEKLPASSTGALIVTDGVVLHGKRDELIALSAETGEKLWSQPKRDIGWLWFQWKDVFVIDGLVWTWSADLESMPYEQRGKQARSQWPASFDAYELHTGEVKQRVPMGNIFRVEHHHRCYRNKATPRFLIASRRGSEFIDLQGGKHIVDNWVRGACHLGQIPANGLHYAPPHPCMCYSNEKLNGFNALAPALESEIVGEPVLERGPAYGKIGRSPEATLSDWPTFRGNTLRSGSGGAIVPAELRTQWAAPAGSRLSAPVAVGDTVYVSAVDEHHILALSAEDGKKRWEFAAGGRVDTPPTYHRGALLFGSADGWVYCLRASDGELVWRFRAGPTDRLIGAFGQLESAWPVHGSVLVQDDLAYFAAGRSSHLDGGIFACAVEAATGLLVHQTKLEGPERDSENIENNFNPPQGALTDVWQSDGERLYMRNNAFNADLSPAAGAGTRVICPAGLLDDTYFKRAPQRLPRGANWGRLLVHDDSSVYLTRMFDSLQCIVPENFFTPGAEGYLLASQPLHQHSQVRVATSPSLNPQEKPLTVEAWVKAEAPDGAIAARGGINHGYALVLAGGKPQFTIRVTDAPYSVTADESVLGRWVHLAGVLTEEKELQVYIDGKLAASVEVPSLLIASPGQAMEVGADAGTGAGEYESPYSFTGLIDEVRLYHRALTGAELNARQSDPEGPASDEALALYFAFDDGTSADASGNENDGILEGTVAAEGKVGGALRFVGGLGAAWSHRVPVRVRALVATGGRLFAAGPPDVIDPDDPLGAFEGRLGGMLWVYAAGTGEKLGEYDLDSPPEFNGMAAAGERLFICTTDGRVVCMGG